MLEDIRLNTTSTRRFNLYLKVAIPLRDNGLKVRRFSQFCVYV